MKALKIASAVFDHLIAILAGAGAVLFVFAWVAICSDVTLRYFANRPQTWLLEIVEYILLYMTFLGTAWVLRREGHVKMEVVLDRLNLRTRACLNMISSFLGALVYMALTWYGAVSTWREFKAGSYYESVLEVPTFPMHAIIAVGSLLLFIQFLRRAYGYLSTWRAPRGDQRNRS